MKTSNCAKSTRSFYLGVPPKTSMFLLAIVRTFNRVINHFEGGLLSICTKNIEKYEKYQCIGSTIQLHKQFFNRLKKVGFTLVLKPCLLVKILFTYVLKICCVLQKNIFE